ncbi:MAG TPA: sugar phosphate isomerase/epimerase [Verrucomicrobiae bacterium]|jgi:inosose dehydratase
MKSTRREFLRTAAAATALTAGCATPPRPPAMARPLVGTQLFGWGQYYQRDGKKLADHHPEVLSAVRDCGYDYAEASLNLDRPEDSVHFAELAKAKGLGVTCFYTGPALHEPQAAYQAITQILSAARAVKPFGTQVINCNPKPIGREKTDEELQAQARALTQLGKGLNELGLKLGVHNHTPEMKNGAREFHHNFLATPPEHVGFCFDVHWVYRGGVPPLEAMIDYGERVVSWHLRQSREGIWWEDLAFGDIDYGMVAVYARANRLAEIYTVELALESGTKITRSVVENHRRSREYVRRVFKA